MWLFVFFFVVFFFFFVQAEDGIRDLVRSRGLGDVYKRQEQARLRGWRPARTRAQRRGSQCDPALRISDAAQPVSYTHLTLPTIYSV